MYDTNQWTNTWLKKLWRHGGFWDTFDHLKGRLHCFCKITYTVSLELSWIFLNFNHLAVSLQIRLKFNCVKPRGSLYWKHIKVLTWNLIISTAGLMTEVVRLIKQQNRNLFKWVWNCIYDNVVMHPHPFVPELQSSGRNWCKRKEFITQSLPAGGLWLFLWKQTPDTQTTTTAPTVMPPTRSNSLGCLL